MRRVRLILIVLAAQPIADLRFTNPAVSDNNDFYVSDVICPSLKVIHMSKQSLAAIVTTLAEKNVLRKIAPALRLDQLDNSPGVA